MNSNTAMLIVAEQVAREQGYIEVGTRTIDALHDWFWGNRAVALEQYPKPLVVQSVKYIQPIFEDEQDNSKRKPKISIDMHFGKPRLTIDLPDGTMACVTYDRDGKCSEAQAFGDRGLSFALEVKTRIDFLLKA